MSGWTEGWGRKCCRGFQGLFCDQTLFPCRLQTLSVEHDDLLRRMAQLHSLDSELQDNRLAMRMRDQLLDHLWVQVRDTLQLLQDVPRRVSGARAAAWISSVAPQSLAYPEHIFSS